MREDAVNERFRNMRMLATVLGLLAPVGIAVAQVSGGQAAAARTAAGSARTAAASPAPANPAAARPAQAMPAHARPAQPRPAPASVAQATPTATPAQAAPPSSSQAAPVRPPSASQAGRRDPFRPLVVKGQNDELPTRLPPGKAGLVIGQLTVQGIVRGLNDEWIAVVDNKTKRAFFLFVGDELFNGTVSRITADSVVFDEQVLDAQGRRITREVVKRLNPS